MYISQTLSLNSGFKWAISEGPASFSLSWCSHVCPILVAAIHDRRFLNFPLVHVDSQDSWIRTVDFDFQMPPRTLSWSPSVRKLSIAMMEQNISSQHPSQIPHLHENHNLENHQVSLGSLSLTSNLIISFFHRHFILSSISTALTLIPEHHAFKLIGFNL